MVQRKSTSNEVTRPDLLQLLPDLFAMHLELTVVSFTHLSGEALAV